MRAALALAIISRGGSRDHAQGSGRSDRIGQHTYSATVDLLDPAAAAPRRRRARLMHRNPATQECRFGLHAWSITSITSINPRAADSVKNILQ
jgi:hypothetical protein